MLYYGFVFDLEFIDFIMLDNLNLRREYDIIKWKVKYVG